MQFVRNSADDGPQALYKLFVHPMDLDLSIHGDRFPGEFRCPNAAGLCRACADRTRTQIYKYFGKDFLDFHEKEQKINPCHVASTTHQHQAR